MRDSVKIIIACIVCLGVVGAAGVYVYFSRNQKQKDRKVVTRPYGDVVQWKYEDEDDTKWRELMNLDILQVDGETPELRVEDGYIQYEKSEGEWINLIPLDSLAGAAGSEGMQGAQGEQGQQGLQGPKGDKGDDGRKVELRASNGYVQWRYENESDWKNLIAVAALSGANGQDGRSVEVRNSGTAIVWRYEGEPDAAWRPIMALAALRGDAGPTGEPGVSGEPGQPGEQGLPGENGKPVQVEVIDGSIQWRYEGDEDWTPLVSVEDLTGAKGEDGADARQIELRQSEDGLTVEWRYTSGEDTAFKPLITLKNGVDGKDGKDGREVEITVRPYKAEVTADPENEITGSPEQKADIAWRYKTGDDTSWKHMVYLDELKGEKGDSGDLLGNIELRVETVKVPDVDADGNPIMVEKKDENGNPVMDPETGAPVMEPQMKDETQVQWRSTASASGEWTKLCLLSNLGVTVPTPEAKFSKTITSTGTVDSLEADKTYLVTMSLAGENGNESIVDASLTYDGGNYAKGTWNAAVVDPDDAENKTYFYASYSSTFTVTGVTEMAFGSDGVDALSDTAILISVVEI